jgi:glycosyltransferase involved in cell wall biosynthesis
MNKLITKIPNDIGFSYIISYRENDEFRKKDLEAVINYILNFGFENFEIILIEQDIKERVKINKNKNIKKIFIYNADVFNKGLGYNIGALNAKYDVLVFCDADIILPKEFLLNALNYTKTFDVVDPYKKIYYYDEVVTNKMIEEGFTSLSDKIDKEIQSFVITGGVFLMKRDKFIEIKGYDETCFGYGHEDDILDSKIKIMGYKLIRMDNQYCIHLYHPLSTPLYYNHIKNNKILAGDYRKLTKDDLLKKINSTKTFGESIYEITSEISVENQEDKDDNFLTKSKNIITNIFKKDTKKPISIIITAHQTHDYIEECLDSIENQTYFKDYNNYEILVGVDDCHVTLKKLINIRPHYRNLRIFMMDSNMGTYVTSNTLINIAKFDNIIRFDSDDVMMPDMVKEIAEKSNDCDLLRFSCYNFTTSINDKIDEKDKFKYPEGVVFYRKKVFNMAGGYRGWKCEADTEFLKRVQNFIRVKETGTYLFYRRIHNNSLTKRKETSLNSDLRNSYKAQIRVYDKNENIKIDRETNSYIEF